MSNQFQITKFKVRHRKGQVLLIAVMLLATVITVVMTIAFNATSETQLSKLEEDSQKALAAADAGVEAALRQSGETVRIESLGSFSSQGITGNATVQTVTKTYFVSPLVEKDEQYTFYLSNYPTFTTFWRDDLTIAFGSEQGQCTAIEVAILATNGTITRYAYNTSCGSIITNALGSVGEQIPPLTLDGVSYQWKTAAIPIENDSWAMLVRVYGGRTKLGVQSVSNLPSQGKTVSSEARTQSGVVKKVELFQSYPQIPVSFFATSF